MDLQAELAARLGVTSAVPVTTTTGEGSEFESSMAPSEGQKRGKKKRKKKKHKDKGLTEKDYEKSASKPNGTLCIEHTYICASVIYTRYK